MLRLGLEVRWLHARSRPGSSRLQARYWYPAAVAPTPSSRRGTPCANSPRETSLGRASKILLAGIGLAIMVRSKLPWRRKCMPLYYMDPTIEEISLSWSSIENRACLIFLAVAFATVAAKPGNLPPRYEGVGAPPARYQIMRNWSGNSPTSFSTWRPAGAINGPLP